MNFCSQCGTPLQPEDRFCTNCGRPNPVGTVVATDVSPAAASPSTIPPAPVSAPPIVSQTEPPAPPIQGAALPAPRRTPSPSFKRPSRKLVILSSVAVVLVAVALTGIVIVQNLLRGGADSPEQAVSKVIDSVSNNDLLGIYAMVTPRERDAVKRTQDAFLKKYEELGLADAAKVLSDEATESSELSFDGVKVSVMGVHPRVEEISDDLAAVTLDSGELKWSINPAKTKGIIRAHLDAANTEEKVSGTQFFADAADGQGVTLMATKVDGRWYISPLISILDASNTAAGGTRGAIPATVAKGAESPQAAAEAAVSAVPRIAHDGLDSLAPYLSHEEAEMVYLYGDLVPDLGGNTVTLGSATFKLGSQDGDRATAVVDHLSLSVNSGNKVTFSSTCLSEQGQTELCLNGSGYPGVVSSTGIDPIFPLLSDQGKFALTTVKEDGAWKVSVLDTAADHAISWVNSITREQALSMLGWQRADKAAGALVLGTRSDVKYNSAGYAVMSLELTDSMRLQLTDDSDGWGDLYTPEGEWLASLGSGYGTDEAVSAGSYIVVMQAGSHWADEFTKKGNKVAYSAPVTLEKYIEPPTIDGDEGSVAGTVYSFSDDDVYDVVVPEGNDVDLVLDVTDVDPSDSEGTLTVSVDGEPAFSLDVQRGTTENIPLPTDAQSHTVTLWLTTSGDSYMYTSAEFELSFANR